MVIKISDLIDVVHQTIIKENDEILDELISIDNKIKNGILENYDVSDCTYWKTIINNHNG